MTPAEMRASSDPRVRDRARCVIYDRTVRLGWTMADALSQPVEPRTSRGGRQLPLLVDPPSDGCFRWGLCEAPTRPR